jgi:hypothetical protein
MNGTGDDGGRAGAEISFSSSGASGGAEIKDVFSGYKVGDGVEVFVQGEWIHAKLVLVSSRSVIAEYLRKDKLFQKLYRNLGEIAPKGTYLVWEEQFDEPVVEVKVPALAQDDLIERAQRQRIANQQLVRQQLRLREDFDRLCQEFGKLKMQFESSNDPNAAKMEFGLGMSLASESEGICPHYLKGKCRFKDKCRQSHDIVYCVYCQAKLPSNKVAASAHLSKCFRRVEDWQKNQGDQANLKS